MARKRCRCEHSIRGQLHDVPGGAVDGGNADRDEGDRAVSPERVSRGAVVVLVESKVSVAVEPRGRAERGEYVNTRLIDWLMLLSCFSFL